MCSDDHTRTHARLTRVRSLSQACPFMQFGPTFPFDALSRLSTLRLDPPGGDRRMRLSHIASARLVAAASRVPHLCVGFRPLSRSVLPFFAITQLEVMPRRLLSLQMHASQFVTWPTLRTWPAANLVHTLVLDLPCEWCVRRRFALRTTRTCCFSRRLQTELRCAFAQGAGTAASASSAAGLDRLRL